jgi:hypothetical protein
MEKGILIQLFNFSFIKRLWVSRNFFVGTLLFCHSLSRSAALAVMDKLLPSPLLPAPSKWLLWHDHLIAILVPLGVLFSLAISALGAISTNQLRCIPDTVSLDQLPAAALVLQLQQNFIESSCLSKAPFHWLNGALFLQTGCFWGVLLFWKHFFLDSESGFLEELQKKFEELKKKEPSQEGEPPHFNISTFLKEPGK